MGYSRKQIDDAKHGADFRDFIPNLSGFGNSKFTTCPFCGKTGKHKGLIVSQKYAKCFSCGGYFKDVIEAVRHYENVDFVTAVKIVAERQGIYLKPQDYD